MTKMYLVKSGKGAHDAGDVIVDLEKVFTFRTAKTEDGEFILSMDYTAQDNVKAFFSTFEELKKELENMFILLGQNVEIINNIAHREMSQDPALKKLKALKELMET